MPDLGKLFDAAVNNNILARIDDTIDDLTQLVSAGAFDVKSLTLTAPQPNLTIFNTPVKLGATAKLAARIANATDKFQPFGEGTDVVAPQGTSYASLEVDAELDASGSGAGNAGALTISAEAAATANMSYRHLLPVAGTKTRLVALTDLAVTTQLPQLADLPDLRNGEVLSFNAMLNVDLGIKAQYGASLDIDDTIALVSDLSLPVKAHAEFTVNAALGLGVYEQVSVVVAKAGQRNEDNWVRIRFARTHRNRITFGAAFTLAVQYDAATGANMLLDKTFAELPMPEVVTELRKIVVEAQKPWSELSADLSKKATDALVTLIGDTGWKEWLDDSPAVEDFLKAANWIVNTYDAVEEKVKSVWEELLARLDDAGFDKVRARIHQLATLDVDNIDIKSLTSGRLDDVIDLIELFSGKDIEELVLTQKVKEGVGKAVAVAKKVDALLDGATENKALELLRGFAQRTGIARVVDWLKKNGTTVQGLQSAAETWLESVIERLTGKLLAQVNQDDVKKLQAFAAKVQKVLDAPAALEAKLKKATAKLKGEFTVSLSIEISRVSESSALVDLEIDPAIAAARDAVQRFLPSGNVRQLLARLDAIKVDEDEPAPYDIRELVLTSRHIRTSTVTLFLSFLGGTRNEKSQVRESTVRIEGGGDVPKRRTGLYTGGVVLRYSGNGITSEGAAWLRIEATSAQIDLSKNYDSFDSGFRLTYVREDVKTTNDELRSFPRILGDLGFLSDGVSFAAPPAGSSTRFSLELDLSSGAVAALVQDIDKQAAFDLDVRNAGIRWFDDKGLPTDADLETGGNMAIAIRSSAFGQTWTDAGDKFNTAARLGKFGVNVWDPIAGRLQVRYTALGVFARSRSLWTGRYKQFAPLSGGAQPPVELENMAGRGVRLFSTASIDWPVPLFNFWLVLSRLSRIQPGVLNDAKGVATFRSRQNDQEEWGAPQWFTLREGIGIPASALRARSFPL